jgi:hypothetical protein
MNAETAATATMMTGRKTAELRPAKRKTYPPEVSTTPVWMRPADMIRRPSSIITVSLLNPAKALSAGSNPVAMTASITPMAVTSAGIRSCANSTTAAARIRRQVAISGVIIPSGA